MRKGLLWPLAAGALLAGVVTVFWFRTEPLPRVRLDANREIRVVHVSVGKHHDFSWEAPWKRALRKVLPRAWRRPLGPEQRQQFSLKHDSLVVWARITGVRKNASRGPISRHEVFTAMPDGSLAAGTAIAWPGIGLRCTFPCFARGETRLPLRLYFGTNVVNLTVRNPRPVAPARWTARSVPQTNDALGTELVLYRFGPHSALLRAIPHDSIYVEGGWVFWNITMFDPWGNWVATSGHSYSSHYINSGLSLADCVWRMEASGVEYIPAAFVDVPPPGEYFRVPLSTRAAQLGVRFVLWAGPGEYRIGPGLDVLCDEAPIQRGEWTFSCSAPSALCISDQLPTGLRLRERVGPGGRVFRNQAGLAAALPPVSAQVFTPQFLEPTTNLQLEVIVTLPTAEFFVQAPQLPRKARKTIHDPF